MDSELLKRLIAEPGHWPFYVIVGASIVFLMKMVSVGAEQMMKHLSEKAKKREGLLSLLSGVGQVILISVVIYVGNSMYWARVIEERMPSPAEKPILTCETTIEIVAKYDEKTMKSFLEYEHILDQGGYLAYCAGEAPLMIVSGTDSWGRMVGTDNYSMRAVLKLDSVDGTAGKPVKILRDAEYAKVELPRLPKEYVVTGGRVVSIINGEIRIEMSIPPQTARNGMVFVRDVATAIHKGLE